MTAQDGATQVFSTVTRLSTLTPTGSVAVGAATYTTNALLKATFTPANETGVDLVTINANGDIATRYKHGDMTKYYNMQIEMATPDPIMSSLLAGGTIFTDSTAALTSPASAPTGTPSSSGGALPNASYYYKVTAANQYGETLASSESSAMVVTGGSNTGSVALTLAAPVTGAVYYRWYGRTTGAEQFIAQTTGLTYTDTGTITPFGALPLTNTTAGPGADVGYQTPELGIVGNPYGVSMEFWGQAIVNGVQAPYLPWWRWVVPNVKNLIVEARTFGPELLPNVWGGQAFDNLAWGTGPFNDWQFDSTKAFQYARAGSATVPTAGFASVPATA